MDEQEYQKDLVTGRLMPKLSNLDVHPLERIGSMAEVHPESQRDPRRKSSSSRLIIRRRSSMEPARVKPLSSPKGPSIASDTGGTRVADQKDVSKAKKKAKGVAKIPELSLWSNRVESFSPITSIRRAVNSEPAKPPDMLKDVVGYTRNFGDVRKAEPVKNSQRLISKDLRRKSGQEIMQGSGEAPDMRATKNPGIPIAVSKPTGTEGRRSLTRRPSSKVAYGKDLRRIDSTAQTNQSPNKGAFLKRLYSNAGIKVPAEQNALKSGPTRKKSIFEGINSSIGVRQKSMARLPSRHSSFARSMSRNGSYLDPSHNYSKHVRQAAISRQMSVSQLEFKELWTKAGASEWEEMDRDEVMQVDAEREYAHVEVRGVDDDQVWGEDMLALDDMLQVKTTLHRRSLFLRYFLNPFSWVRKLWNMVLVGLILIQILVEPFIASFHYPALHLYYFPRDAHMFGEPGGQPVWNPYWSLLLVMGYFVDVLFIIDYIAQFFTVKISDGRAVVEEGAIRSIYMGTTGFKADSLSLIPAEFVGFACGRPDLVFALRVPFKLSRILRLNKYAEHFARNIRANTNFIWLCNLFVLILILEHWIACSWFVIGLSQSGFSEHSSWLEYYDVLHPGTSVGRRYVLCIYWTTVTLTSVGYGDITPKASAEHFFAVMIMLLGHGLYAYIFGLMSTMVSNLDYAGARFRTKIDGVRQFMAYRILPEFLCNRIDSYYDHLWAETKGFNEMKIIKELPDSISLDVSLYLYRDFIQRVPLFQDTEPGFIRSLVTLLQPQIYPSYEYLIRKDEVGREMYFVQRGVCEVVEETSGAVLFVLEEGSYFGEIALLVSERRTASVRTATVSDMLILTKSDLELVLECYPYVRTKIKTQAKKRQREKDAREKAVKTHIVELFKKNHRVSKLKDKLKGHTKEENAQTIATWWREKILRKKSFKGDESVHPYSEAHDSAPFTHDLDKQPVSKELRKPLHTFREEEEDIDA